MAGFQPNNIVQMFRMGEADAIAEQQRNEQQQQKLRIRDMIAQNIGPDGQVDYNKVASSLLPVDPESGFKFQQLATANQTASANAAMAKQKQALQSFETLGRIANTVKDEPTYQRAKKLAVSMGIPTEDWPSNYDPAAVESFKAGLQLEKEEFVNVGGSLYNKTQKTWVQNPNQTGSAKPVLKETSSGEYAWIYPDDRGVVPTGQRSARSAEMMAKAEDKQAEREFKTASDPKIAGILAKPKQTENLISSEFPKIEAALKRSTGSTAGALIDMGYRAAGQTNDGMRAIGELEVLSNKLLMNVERFEGPQGVLDVELYKKAAGDLANPTKTREERMAAFDIIKDQYNKKLAYEREMASGLQGAAGRGRVPQQAAQQPAQRATGQQVPAAQPAPAAQPSQQAQPPDVGLSRFWR